MITEETKEIIKEKELEIERLKAELKELKQTSIASSTENKMLYMIKFDSNENKPVGIYQNYGGAWNHIRLACQSAFLYQFDSKRYKIGVTKKQEKMSSEEREIAVKMADEMIAIFNKYVALQNPVLEFYGNEYTWGEE